MDVNIKQQNELLRPSAIRLIIIIIRYLTQQLITPEIGGSVGCSIGVSLDM